MTTQNEASGQSRDLAFFVIGKRPSYLCTPVKVVQGITCKCFSAVTDRQSSAPIDLADGCGTTIASFCDNNMGVCLSSVLEPKVIHGKEFDAVTMEVEQGDLRHGQGYYETGCEILKQLADRFHYKCRHGMNAVCGHFLPGNNRHRINVSNGLTEREAKFFLDRGIQSSYHALKFSGDFPARSKFHLHTGRKIVNCFSQFWGGAKKPLAGHDSTRFREAETGRPNQANESIPRLRSLREDRPVGVISIPSAHGRRRI